MKIRAIIPNEPGNASNWWRIISPFNKLVELGIDAKYSGHDIDVRQLDLMHSIVVVHRIIPADPKQYMKVLRSRGATKVIYSMDDYTIDRDVLEEYLTECGGLTTFAIDKMVGRIPRQIEFINLCDGVLVSSEYLANLVEYKTHPPIDVLPNSIDETWFDNALKTPSIYQDVADTIHIGYASGRRPRGDLEDMAKAWGRIDKEFENVRFVVAGYPQNIIDENVNLDKRIRIPWQSIEQHPRSMRVDIGCCPLAETVYNDGKSPIKYYEYALAGAAVLASPIQYYGVIAHALDGMIVWNEEEWYRHLRSLVINERLRKYLVMNALYKVSRYRTLDANIHKWIKYFEELVAASANNN